jgi:hypothetical protein
MLVRWGVALSGDPCSNVPHSIRLECLTSDVFADTSDVTTLMFCCVMDGLWRNWSACCSILLQAAEDSLLVVFPTINHDKNWKLFEDCWRIAGLVCCVVGHVSALLLFASTAYVCGPKQKGKVKRDEVLALYRWQSIPRRFRAWRLYRMQSTIYKQGRVWARSSSRLQRMPSVARNCSTAARDIF